MKTLPPNNKPGFALVVTLTLMVLLSILAIGLLSLSTVSLRSMNASSPAETARANARMAVMMALGELQRTSGDDRRITADGSIFAGAKNPNVVGVWKSWSPQLANRPNFVNNDPKYYTDPKTKTAAGPAPLDPGFLRWLVSSPTPADLQSADWAKSGILSNPVDLFAQSSDGFRLQGSKVDVKKGTVITGSFAWAVSQAATKAKINVAGPEDNQRIANDDIQAQPRPTLDLTNSFKHPTGDWNERAAKVVSMNQAELDSDLWSGTASIQGGADFTAQGYGVLADVVNGGLKTDLSLGFEMSDSDFAQDQWGQVKSPFHSTNAPVIPPNSYGDQRPLFTPLTQTGSVTANLVFDTAEVQSEYPAATVPTFNTLRSFYRTPHHLYKSGGQTTVFERPFDHVAVKQQIAQPPGTAGPFPTPGLGPKGLRTQTSYRPVLDRVVFVLSAGLKKFDNTSSDVRLVMTPLVTLWNPYNVALEIEGAMVYPWIDMPFSMNWEFSNATTGANEGNPGASLANTMGYQFRNVKGHGRSVDPYFFASITDGGQPIRFEPGEVRVFGPASADNTEYLVAGTVAQRTIKLKPAGNISAKGGLAIPMNNTARGQNSWTKMKNTQKVLVEFRSAGGSYPFFVSVEDATRANNPTTRGELIGDVQTVNFSNSGGNVKIRSQKYEYNALLAEPQVFGMLETYHRVARDTAPTRRADLVSTVNPRQTYINRYLTEGSFQAAPHYETVLRPLPSTDGAIQTTPDGRSAFYGASNAANSGSSHLSFFEVPQAPLLSLAGFVNADLTGTAYAPSYQVANSWASAYLGRTSAAKLLPNGGGGGGDASFKRGPLPVYDFSYLANEALWDSFFFSGAAPTLQPGSASGSPNVWNSPVANVTRKLEPVINQFVENPAQNPLRNPRMKLHLGNTTRDELAKELIKPEGTVTIAAHLLVDGAFNVNSTSVEAWQAFLAGMRGKSFQVDGGSAPSSSKTGFPRFRNPVGTEDDNWHGFRSLSDSQIKELATNLVAEVRLRGPFLSLAEFVNRRISGDALGLKGALQSAIDKTSINDSALYDTFDIGGYPADGKANLPAAEKRNNTGVGIPGYLTQADVLQSIAPSLTVRSDTFTIRGYGEARDKNNNVTAVARCEMVVQRIPEYVDPANPAYTPVLDTTPANQNFGRKFDIVSFRYLDDSEVGL